MAGIKISALPAVPSAQLTDVFPVVQSGTTYKESNSQLLSLFQSSLTTSITGTLNEVLVNGTVGVPQTGAVTLTLPQPIAMTSSPIFNSLELTSGEILDKNSNIVLDLIPATSAVNFLTILNSVSGAAVAIQSNGADTNVQLNLFSKGTSPVVFGTTGTSDQMYVFTGPNFQHQTAFTFPTSATPQTVTWPDATGTVAFTNQLPTPSALTESNDTNVTLTLGGTPLTALLQPVSLILGWTGTLAGTRGGTGVNNGASTITLGGSLTTSGAFATTFTMTNTTSVTFPTSGTLATVGGSVVSLQGTANQVLVNGTSGSAVTGTAITLTTPQNIGTSNSPTFNNLTLSGGNIYDTNSNAILNLAATASAVNYLTIENAATGTAVTIQPSSGTDTNVQLNVFSKGTSSVVFGSTGLTNQFIYFTGTAFAHETIFNMPATANTRTVTFPDSSGTLAYTSQLPTPAALTSSNDTNVTITLGGTPSTALLQATSLTMGWSGQLSLARGGTASNLTASNGGIFYSTASAGAILSGTATATQMLQSGASTTPAWSTTTWPATSTINQLLYSSSANVIAGLATANSSVLVTSAGGIPSLSTTLPSGLTIPGYQASITPAALTSSNDTNVTISLGGTPATALLQAASITMGWTGQLGLTRGGTAASLTASNGGIVYSTASALAILAGTATAGQMLQSGASTTPAWSTSTYPATNAINTLLYASSANVMAALATANSGVLVTSSGGIPSISTTLPSGLAATNLTLTTPTLGAATATSINFGGSTLSNYVSETNWTPAFNFATTGNLSVTYSTQQGVYTRIGSIVFYKFSLGFTPTFTTSSGAMQITGLPLTSGSFSNTVNTIDFETAFTFPAGCTSPLTIIGANATLLTIYGQGSAVGLAPFSTSAIVSGVAQTIDGSGFYFV